MSKKSFIHSKISTIILYIILILTHAGPAYARINNPILPPTLGSGTEPGAALAYMIANIWKAFVIVGSIFFVLYFAWGAMRWMTAQGDKAKFEEGRNKISNGLIGLVLLASSVAIIQLLGGLLDIQFLEDLQFNFPTP